MLRGFAVDRSQQYYMNLTWADGEPENSQLFGFKGSNLDLNDKLQYVIRGLKCEKCGFLDLYAV